MRKVLLAWELGAGFGHITALRRVAARLQASGVRCVAAVKNVSSAGALRESGIEVLQAPIWPVLFETDQYRRTQSSVTLGDTIADAGLADPRALSALVSAWRALIDLVRPDLVMGDYAPAAALAARGRIPLALIGTGYTLPPDSMPSFPRLHPYGQPRWSEPDLQSTVNAVLDDLGLTPLQRLPQLFSADAKWINVFPLLDPYADARDVPAQGPALEYLPKARRADGKDIRIYFSSWSGVPEPVLRAFRHVAQRTRIFAPGFPPDELRHLAALGMQVDNKPFDIREDLVTTRLVVHLGSAGFASDALIAGVPQAICAIDIEKQLIGDALEQAGVGRKLSVWAPDITLTEEMVQSLLDDASRVERAGEIAAMLRAQYGASDPLKEFCAACLRLMA